MPETAVFRRFATAVAGVLLFPDSKEKQMKKFITLAAILVLSTAACEQKTEREVTPTSTTETTTITTPSVDTAAVTDAANDAAHQTGTAMETAGQAIQEETTTTKTDTN